MVSRPWRRDHTDQELERALARLGRAIDYPPTPDLTRSVRARIEAEDPARPQARRWTRPWLRLTASRPALAAVVVAALLLLLATVLILSPTTRSAVADRLGLPGLVITADPPPTAISTPVATAQASPVRFRAAFGPPLPLEAAQARVAYRIHLPTAPGLDQPDAIYLVQPPATGQVILAYAPRADLPPISNTDTGLLITQFLGRVEPGFFVKAIGPYTTVTPVMVDGAQGYWIDGETHAFFYRSPNGDVERDSIRTVGDVLIWERDGLILRLESALSRDEALRIAESIR